MSIPSTVLVPVTDPIEPFQYKKGGQAKNQSACELEVDKVCDIKSFYEKENLMEGFKCKSSIFYQNFYYYSKSKRDTPEEMGYHVIHNLLQKLSPKNKGNQKRGIQ